jgi:hypothetical protein
VLIIRGGLDGSGTEALYQAPTSSASARRSMAPDMLRSSAAATICLFADGAFDGVWIQCRVFSPPCIFSGGVLKSRSPHTR